MSKLRNFMMFAAILGISLAGNVFANEAVTTKEVVPTVVTEEATPAVQPADVAKDVKKVPCKAPKAKKVKAEKVETVTSVDTTTVPAEETPANK